jgi:hypothetical protein
LDASDRFQIGASLQKFSQVNYPISKEVRLHEELYLSVLQ